MGDVGVLNFDLTFLQTMIVNWVNVGIVAFIMYVLLYGPVKKMLKEREDKIAGQISDANTQLKDAGTLKDEYEKKLKNIEAERAEILDSARKRGSEREEQIVSAAKQEAADIKNRAMLDIEREKSKAADEMRKQIIEVSSLMASRFVKDTMDDAAKAQLLDKSIADLEGVKWPS